MWGGNVPVKQGPPHSSVPGQEGNMAILFQGNFSCSTGTVACDIAVIKLHINNISISVILGSE
jgi:hypothetical protein